MIGAHIMQKRLPRLLGKLIENSLLNTSPLVIHYVDKTKPGGYDPNVESSYGDAAEQKTVTVNGLVHVVSARTNVRQFTEIKTGDLIVSFEAEPRDVNNQDNDTNVVDLKQLDQVRFEFQGDFYVQQAVGKDLMQYWDVVLGGYPVSQTILLRTST